MIGAFIYILRVHHVFHAHTTHELLGYVGDGVAPRVCYGNNKITELRTILQRESQNS